MVGSLLEGPMPTFELQGHRGARGLAPENTLPSFERAFDVGVTSVETDLHLTRDGAVVLCHDPFLSERVHSVKAPPGRPVLVSSLTLDQLRTYPAAGNPDPGRFPEQEARVTPLAERFTQKHRLHPF